MNQVYCSTAWEIHVHTLLLLQGSDNCQFVHYQSMGQLKSSAQGFDD